MEKGVHRNDHFGQEINDDDYYGNDDDDYDNDVPSVLTRYAPICRTYRWLWYMTKRTKVSMLTVQSL